MDNKEEIKKQIVVLETQLAHLRPSLNKKFDTVDAFYEDNELMFQSKEFVNILKQKNGLEWFIKTKKERYEYRIYHLKLAEKFNDNGFNDEKIQFMTRYIKCLKHIDQKMNNKKNTNEMNAMLQDIYERMDKKPFMDFKKLSIPDAFFIF